MVLSVHNAITKQGNYGRIFKGLAIHAAILKLP